MAVLLLYLLCAKQTTDEVKQSDFIRYKRTDDITVFLMELLFCFLILDWGQLDLCYMFRFSVTLHQILMYTRKS